MQTIRSLCPLVDHPSGIDAICIISAECRSAQEAEQLAADIEANADPRKWICVEAESKIVDFSGDTVILIMTSADLAEQLHSGFTAAVAE